MAEKPKTDHAILTELGRFFVCPADLAQHLPDLLTTNEMLKAAYRLSYKFISPGPMADDYRLNLIKTWDAALRALK